MIDELFLIPFAISSVLALLQLMDPERFVVSTSSGSHPFMINRWRSNRDLTNLAMDIVDQAMIDVPYAVKTWIPQNWMLEQIRSQSDSQLNRKNDRRQWRQQISQ